MEDYLGDVSAILSERRYVVLSSFGSLELLMRKPVFGCQTSNTNWAEGGLKLEITDLGSKGIVLSV